MKWSSFWSFFVGKNIVGAFVYNTRASSTSRKLRWKSEKIENRRGGYKLLNIVIQHNNFDGDVKLSYLRQYLEEGSDARKIVASEPRATQRRKKNYSLISEKNQERKWFIWFPSNWSSSTPGTMWKFFILRKGTSCQRLCGGGYYSRYENSGI